MLIELARGDCLLTLLSLVAVQLLDLQLQVYVFNINLFISQLFLFAQDTAN